MVCGPVTRRRGRSLRSGPGQREPLRDGTQVDTAHEAPEPACVGVPRRMLLALGGMVLLGGCTVTHSTRPNTAAGGTDPAAPRASGPPGAQPPPGPRQPAGAPGGAPGRPPRAPAPPGPRN